MWFTPCHSKEYKTALTALKQWDRRYGFKSNSTQNNQDVKLHSSCRCERGLFNQCVIKVTWKGTKTLKYRGRWMWLNPGEPSKHPRKQHTRRYAGLSCMSREAFSDDSAKMLPPEWNWLHHVCSLLYHCPPPLTTAHLTSLPKPGGAKGSLLVGGGRGKKLPLDTPLQASQHWSSQEPWNERRFEFRIVNFQGCGHFIKMSLCLDLKSREHFLVPEDCKTS